MAKTKYFAIDALGNKHTRTSARTYTHMVVVQVSQVKRRAYLSSEENRKYHAKNYAFHCQEAGANAQYTWSETDMTQFRETAAMTRDEYIAKRISASLAELNKKGAGEYEDFYRDFGWCGRLDLAQKLAAKWAGHGKVEILEAQQA